MSQVPQRRLTARVARAARLLRWAVLALLPVVALGHLAALAPGLLAHIQVRFSMVGTEPTAWLTAARLLGGLLFLAALLELARMLRRLEHSEMFASPVTALFRRFAGLLLLSIAMATLVQPVLAIIDPCLASVACVREIAVDVRGLTMLLMAVLFFLVARLLDEARRLEEENREFV
jgi:hypothetical protein